MGVVPALTDEGGCSGAHRRRGRSYTSGVPRHLRFRPPGLKPTTKVGALGPYRGRLGVAWVIAPIVVGLVLAVAAAVFFLAR